MFVFILHKLMLHEKLHNQYIFIYDYRLHWWHLSPTIVVRAPLIALLYKRPNIRLYCEGTVTVPSGIALFLCGYIDAGLQSPEPPLLQQPQPSATQPRRRQLGWNRSACMRDPSASPPHLLPPSWNFPRISGISDSGPAAAPAPAACMCARTCVRACHLSHAQLCLPVQA